MRLAGPAFTVRGSPKSDITPDESLLRWTEFLSAAPSGSVVVLQGNDNDRALMGELSAETLQYRGVKGFVTDGGCRDCDFIEKIGFPVFCKFTTPKDVVGAWSPDAFEDSLRFDQLTVCSGDLVLGDVDGVVVIPAKDAEEIVAEVEKVMNTENLVREAILEGVDPKEAYLRQGRF